MPTSSCRTRRNRMQPNPMFPKSVKMTAMIHPVSGCCPFPPAAMNRLGMTADRWRKFLSRNRTPSSSLDDICYTAAVRRTHHKRRLAVVGASRDELIERIEKSIE